MSPDDLKELVATRMQQAAEFVRPGLLAKELSEDLHGLFEARQEDDYQRLDPMPQEEAAEGLVLAEGFVQAIRQHLTGKGLLTSS